MKRGNVILAAPAMVLPAFADKRPDGSWEAWCSALPDLGTAAAPTAAEAFSALQVKADLWAARMRGEGRASGG